MALGDIRWLQRCGLQQLRSEERSLEILPLKLVHLREAACANNHLVPCLRIHPTCMFKENPWAFPSDLLRADAWNVVFFKINLFDFFSLKLFIHFDPILPHTQLLPDLSPPSTPNVMFFLYLFIKKKERKSKQTEKYSKQKQPQQKTASQTNKNK